MSKRMIVTAVATAAALLLTAAALAAKPSSSISLVVLPTDGARTTASTEPAWGGQITFDVVTSQSDRPFVNVQCYQGTRFVYDGWAGFFASYLPGQNYMLASTYWTGGAADCTARLLYWDKSGRQRTLATTSFHVSA